MKASNVAEAGLVETVDLTKNYGGFTAVDRLSLRVEEGEVFGLLGPNGAGKTTTILMLLGLTEPTSGTARVCGYDSTREPLQVKRLAGYLPENVGFYPDLTARQNLAYTARLNGMMAKEATPWIDELLELVGLSGPMDQKVGTFSRGMKQRLGIADVLVKRPKVVFLDEPTLGIDPDGVGHVLNLIEAMSREQRITVLLSSHLLHQVQRVCHRVGIFAKGRMVVQGPIESLNTAGGSEGHLTIEVQATSPGLDLEALRGLEGVKGVERSGELLLVQCDRDLRAEISKVATQAGCALLHLRLRGLGLEEIYLRYFREA